MSTGKHLYNTVGNDTPDNTGKRGKMKLAQEYGKPFHYAAI